MKKYLAMSAAFVAFSAQPLQITDLAHFDDVGLFSKADAGNGRGGGNDGGNGNGGNGGGSDARSNAGNGSGHAQNGQDAQDDVSSDTDTLTDETAQNLNRGRAVGKSGEKNLSAQLGRLNSLKRNINGLMKSSDPHMAEIRTYILNSVELTKAEASLAAAQTSLADAQAQYDAAVAAHDQAVADYNAALANPDTATTADSSGVDAALATMQAAEANLAAAQTAVTSAEAAVAEYQALTTDEVLTNALLEGSNTGVVTPAILEWSKSVLGVGDEIGAIDAYMVKFK